MQLLDCLEISLSEDAMASPEMQAEHIRYSEILAHLNSDNHIWKIGFTPQNNDTAEKRKKFLPKGKITSNRLRVLGDVRNQDVLSQNSIAHSRVESMMFDKATARGSMPSKAS
jgi:hypothetical protein